MNHLMEDKRAAFITGYNLPMYRRLAQKIGAKGYSRDGIAEELYISNRTVGRHLSNIFEKLEARNINQAVAIALDNGYIPPLY